MVIRSSAIDAIGNLLKRPYFLSLHSNSLQSIFLSLESSEAFVSNPTLTLTLINNPLSLLMTAPDLGHSSLPTNSSSSSSSSYPSPSFPPSSSSSSFSSSSSSSSSLYSLQTGAAKKEAIQLMHTLHERSVRRLVSTLQEALQALKSIAEAALSTSSLTTSTTIPASAQDGK